MRSRNRETSVKKWMLEDEAKDRLVQNHRTPQGIKCDTCNTRMYLNGHLFKDFEEQILFVFDCPNEHKSRKIVYPNGDLMVKPKPKCQKCGYILSSNSQREKYLLTIITFCKECGDKSVEEYDLTPDQPIDEADRKKYCIDFKNQTTFIEDLESIAKLAKYIEASETEEKIKKDCGVDKIEKLTIPQMEQKLIKMTEAAGFIKFQLDKPVMERYVTVKFLVQDPSTRNSNESIKALTKSIKAALFPTNWRLMSAGISYRLGLLDGQLKAYEDDEGLMKIGKEIMEAASSGK